MGEVPMGFEMEWRDSHGRKVSREQWTKSLQDKAVGAALKDLEKQIHGKVAALRCRVHGERPNIKTKIEGHLIKSEITACCEDMTAKAQKIATNQAH